MTEQAYKVQRLRGPLGLQKTKLHTDTKRPLSHLHVKVIYAELAAAGNREQPKEYFLFFSVYH